MIQSVETDDVDSPFLIENKEICEFWDKFISNKGGSARGKYTAWAFQLKGKFQSHYNWNISLKKSSSTSGSLTVSNDEMVFKQALFVAASVNLGTSNFILRKSRFTDRLKKLLKMEITRINSKSKYVLDGTLTNKHLKELKKILNEPIQNGHLEFVKYTASTRELTIDIRSFAYTSIAERIVSYGEDH